MIQNHQQRGPAKPRATHAPVHTGSTGRNYANASRGGQGGRGRPGGGGGGRPGGGGGRPGGRPGGGNRGSVPNPTR